MAAFCIALSAFIEPESDPPEEPSDPDPDDTLTVEIHITTEPPPPPEALDALVNAHRRSGYSIGPRVRIYELGPVALPMTQPWWIVEQAGAERVRCSP